MENTVHARFEAGHAGDATSVGGGADGATRPVTSVPPSRGSARRHTGGGAAVTLVLSAALSVACALPGGDRERSGPDGWPPPADVVERGRVLYAEHCAVCHGDDGQGEPNWTVRNADGSYPAPPHDSSGHTWHHPDGVLFQIVHDGGARPGMASFPSRMPAWGDVLTDDEIRAVITYLKTLWGPDERAFQAERSEQQPFPPAGE